MDPLKITSSIFLLLIIILNTACGSSGDESVEQPSITSFSASPNPITVGDTSTLTAVFSGGNGIIDNDVGAVTSGVGVTVTPTATTT